MFNSQVDAGIRRVLIAVVLLFVLCIATAPHTAFAHSASHATLVHHGGPTQRMTFVFRGKTYTLTPGETVSVPDTLPDGTQGYLVAKFNVTPDVQATGARPSSDPCDLNAAGLSQNSVVGNVIWSYTLFQYWCWDGTYITRADAPYAQWYTNGWSLANHAEWVITNGVWWQYGYEESEGNFRFNGPFGFGCASGYIQLYEWFDGSTDGTTGGLAHEYGC